MPSIALQNRIEALEAKVAEQEKLLTELVELMNGPDGHIEMRQIRYPATLRKLGFKQPARPLKPGESRADVPEAPTGHNFHGVPVGGGKQQ